MKTPYFKFSLLLTCSFVLLLFCSLPAHSTENQKDGWQFQIATYAWLAGQSGTVATLPGLPAADIDIDFWDDISGNINGALFLVGEAKKDRFGVFMDFAYTDIELENPTPGTFFSYVSSQTKTLMVTAAGFYRVVDTTSAFVDLLAGIRYWYLDSSLTLGAGDLPRQAVDNTENWIDPLIGIKGLSYLGESKFYISGGLLLGGFGAGSDLMWDANINLGYTWTETFSTTIGYRYLDVDYEDGWYVYDVSQDGPTLGLSWRF